MMAISKFLKGISRRIKRVINKISNGLTLKKICNYIDIDVPKEYKKEQNKLLNGFSCNAKRIKKDGAFFIVTYGMTSKKVKAQQAYLGGAKYIFSNKEYFLDDGRKIPYIYVENPNKAYQEVCKALFDKYDIKVVAVTGSVGKTTTKDMIYQVISQKYKTIKNMGNFNQIGTLSEVILKLNNSYEYYVQEMGAGINDLKILSYMSYILKPYVAVITNIGSSHLETYKTKENLITLKTGIEDYLREDGYVLVNGDDESLANHKFKHKVRYYGLNKKNDYYADNINIKGVSMTFDIVDKILDNRFTITLDLLGEHNIYNVLVSYATGKIAGLSDEEIILGLKSFKTTGIRQNYVKINGYNLFIDCYNAAPASVRNALKVVKDIEVEKGNKKIAVLGDMLELGKDEIDLHREMGKVIKDYDIDYLFCYGTLSKYIADEAKKAGVKTIYSDDKEVIVKEVKKVMKQGDLILFKASNGMNLPEIIDKLFKTEFSKKK